jgi:hypothetical protein
VEGLRPDIRREVKTYRPWTIVAAFSFARVQEKLSDETHRTTRTFNRPAANEDGSSSTPTQKTLCLTQKELKEKTARGLCWHCDEKWHIGHMCKQGKLLMIELRVKKMAQEMDSSKAEQEDDEPIGGDDDKVTYIVHALAGYSNP